MNNAEEGFGHLDKIREVLFSARTRELVPMYWYYDPVELATCCCCCGGFILDPLSITIWNGRFSLLFFWQCYGWNLLVSNLFGKVGMLGACRGGGGPDCTYLKILRASKLWCLYNCCKWRQISACFFLSLLLLPYSINNFSKPLQRTSRVWALKLVCPHFSPFHPPVSFFFQFCDVAKITIICKPI